MNGYHEQMLDAFRYELKPLLEKYLKRPSLDGNTERQDLRKQMVFLLENIDNLQRECDKATDW